MNAKKPSWQQKDVFYFQHFHSSSSLHNPLVPCWQSSSCTASAVLEFSLVSRETQHLAMWKKAKSLEGVRCVHRAMWVVERKKRRVQVCLSQPLGGLISSMRNHQNNYFIKHQPSSLLNHFLGATHLSTSRARTLYPLVLKYNTRKYHILQIPFNQPCLEIAVYQFCII